MITNANLHAKLTKEFDRFKAGESTEASRLTVANEVTEDYFDLYGKWPAASVIERAATLLLVEDLADTNPYKVSHTEQPFLTELQLDRREERERKAGVVEYGNDRCIGRKKTHYVDKDGTPQVRNSKIFSPI